MNKPYRWNADDYAAHSSAQLKWAQELIQKLGLQGHETVLDIGCGDGKITAQMAGLLPEGRIMGIDLSADMIALARMAFPVEHHANLSFEVKDAAALDFDADYDIVFSNAVLHWIKDHQPVLTGLARALKVGGRFLLQMGGQGNAAGILKVLDKLFEKAEWRGCFQDFEFPYGFYSEVEYGPWLKAAGLAAERIELIPKDMVQDGPDGLAGWVRTTWLPYTNRVPAERREAFIEEIVETYLTEYPLDDEGDVHVAMVRLEVRGRKGTNHGVH